MVDKCLSYSFHTDRRVTEEISETRYAKIGLKTYVTVISKEGLVGTSPTKPSFGMTLTKELYSFVNHKLYLIAGVIPKVGLSGLVPAKPSFGMTMTKTF